eukprot:TRINITY_DN3819_c1_g1_i1.p1 TRINITY_DN3819_c1_g1~~TRINITY_DN3819_c1_g1_i1.p1  ORF type:complete len:1363 (+),score=275.25 TRINITY_DN3819_c1_g1_i1:88-4176(+)
MQDNAQHLHKYASPVPLSAVNDDMNPARVEKRCETTVRRDRPASIPVHVYASAPVGASPCSILRKTYKSPVPLPSPLSPKSRLPISRSPRPAPPMLLPVPHVPSLGPAPTKRVLLSPESQPLSPRGISTFSRPRISPPRLKPDTLNPVQEPPSESCTPCVSVLETEDTILQYLKTSVVQVSLPVPVSREENGHSTRETYLVEREKRREARRAERTKERELEREKSREREDKRQKFLYDEKKKKIGKQLIELVKIEERERRKLDQMESRMQRARVESEGHELHMITQRANEVAAWERRRLERLNGKLESVQTQEVRERTTQQKLESRGRKNLVADHKQVFEELTAKENDKQEREARYANELKRLMSQESTYRSQLETSYSTNTSMLRVLCNYDNSLAVICGKQQSAFDLILFREHNTRKLIDVTDMETEEREDFELIYNEEIELLTTEFKEETQNLFETEASKEAAELESRSTCSSEVEDNRFKDTSNDLLDETNSLTCERKSMSSTQSDENNHSIKNTEEEEECEEVEEEEEGRESSVSGTLSNLSSTTRHGGDTTSLLGMKSRETSSPTEESAPSSTDDMSILERRLTKKTLDAECNSPLGSPRPIHDPDCLTIQVPNPGVPASPRARTPSTPSGIASPMMFPKRPPLPPYQPSKTPPEHNLLSPVLSPAFSSYNSRPRGRNHSVASGLSNESRISPLAGTIAAVRSALKAGKNKEAAEALEQVTEHLGTDMLAMKLLNEVKTGIAPSPGIGYTEDGVNFSPERLTAMTLAMLEEHVKLQECLWSDETSSYGEEYEDEEEEEDEEDEETDEESDDSDQELLAPESIYFKGLPDAKTLQATTAYTAVRHNQNNYAVRFAPTVDVATAEEAAITVARAANIDEANVTAKIGSEGDFECSIKDNVVENITEIKKKLKKTMGNVEVSKENKALDGTKLLMAKLLSWYSSKAGDVVMELVQNLRYPPHVKTRLQKRKTLSKIAKSVLDKGEYINASAVEVLVLRQYTQKPMDIDRDLGWTDVPMPPDSDSDVAGKLLVNDYEKNHSDWDWSQHLENPAKRNGSLFGPVCAALRDQGPGGSCGAWSEAVLRKWIKWLMTVSAIVLPDTEEFLNIKLYRGLGAGGLPSEVVTNHRLMSENTLLTWPALSSCSLDKAQSTAYMHGHGQNTTNRPTDTKPGTILFELEGATAGARLAPLSQYPEEEEVLLGPLMTFKITDVKEDHTNQFGCGLHITMVCEGLMGCAGEEEREDLKTFLNGVREDGWCSSMGLLRTVTSRASDLWMVVRNRRRSTFSGKPGDLLNVPDDLPIPRLKSIRSMRESRHGSGPAPGLPGWVQARVAAIDGKELDFFSTMSQGTESPTPSSPVND